MAGSVRPLLNASPVGPSPSSLHSRCFPFGKKYFGRGKEKDRKYLGEHLPVFLSVAMRPQCLQQTGLNGRPGLRRRVWCWEKVAQGELHTQSSLHRGSSLPAETEAQACSVNPSQSHRWDCLEGALPSAGQGIGACRALVPRHQHWQHQHSSVLLAVREAISHSPWLPSPAPRLSLLLCQAQPWEERAADRFPGFSTNGI